MERDGLMVGGEERKGRGQIKAGFYRMGHVPRRPESHLVIRLGHPLSKNAPSWLDGERLRGGWPYSWRAVTGPAVSE